MVLVLHAVAGAQQAAPKSDACPRCLAEVLEAQPTASRAHLPTLFSSLPLTSTINSTCETKDLLIATLLAELAAARAEIRELRLRARSPPVSRRGVARDTDIPRGPGPSASQLRESANPVSASSRRRVSAGPYYPYYADMCRLTHGLVLAAFCRLLARKLARATGGRRPTLYVASILQMRTRRVDVPRPMSVEMPKYRTRAARTTSMKGRLLGATCRAESLALMQRLLTDTPVPRIGTAMTVTSLPTLA
jgi:hypothetical protein